MTKIVFCTLGMLLALSGCGVNSNQGPIDSLSSSRAAQTGPSTATTSGVAYCQCNLVDENGSPIGIDCGRIRLSDYPNGCSQLNGIKLSDPGNPHWGGIFQGCTPVSSCDPLSSAD